LFLTWLSHAKQCNRGVLSSEILGNKIYTHVVSGHEYAARVRNLRTYDAVRYGRNIKTKGKIDAKFYAAKISYIVGHIQWFQIKTGQVKQPIRTIALVYIKKAM